MLLLSLHFPLSNYTVWIEWTINCWGKGRPRYYVQGCWNQFSLSSCDHDRPCRLPFNSFYSKDNIKGNVVSPSHTAGCVNINTSPLVTVTSHRDYHHVAESAAMSLQWFFFEQYHDHCSCVQLFQSVPLHSNGTNQEKRQAHTSDNIYFRQQTGNMN